MSERRPADVSVHDWHHKLIDERVAIHEASPRRSGLDKLRRREHGKRAVWTLRSHLTGEHGRRGLSPLLSLHDLVWQHEDEHRRNGS